MIQRVMPDLMGLKNVMVLNDEAHHCYREKPAEQDDDALKGDDKKEAEKNNAAARLWISGIEAVNRKLGVARVMDLSATPFFLPSSAISTHSSPTSQQNSEASSTRFSADIRRRMPRENPSPVPACFHSASVFRIHHAFSWLEGCHSIGQDICIIPPSSFGERTRGRCRKARPLLFFMKARVDGAPFLIQPSATSLPFVSTAGRGAVPSGAAPAFFRGSFPSPFRKRKSRP
jgi:hypothetical protein